MPLHEINFDGIVGPTHNYAGLAAGNFASQKFKSTISNPKAAALEGLAKMKLLASLGVKQAVLPPQVRPDVAALRRFGFSGTDGEIIEKAYRSDPGILAACSSASAMWAANAATVSPSSDTADGRVHFTPANLFTNKHRSIETAETARIFREIFNDERHFVHHPPLPAVAKFSDEGAANHTRLAATMESHGVEMFFFGDARKTNLPARQSRNACVKIATTHRLNDDDVFIVELNSKAIDAGVFHNDVISVGHQNVLLMHELAYADKGFLEKVRKRISNLIVIEASEKELPIAQAVDTYLFNSQIVSLPNGSMCLIAPIECEMAGRSQHFIQRILAEDNPIRSVRFANVRQSMQNGGGPACLRLRVLLNDDELRAVKSTVFYTEELHAQLIAWVNKHYRDRLAPADLADPKLLDESRSALSELGQILDLKLL